MASFEHEKLSIDRLNSTQNGNGRNQTHAKFQYIAGIKPKVPATYNIHQFQHLCTGSYQLDL